MKMKLREEIINCWYCNEQLYHRYKHRLQLPEFTDPVVIVGGGLAGLSATLQAIHDGANVVLIEGEKDLGGNSQKVTC